MQLVPHRYLEMNAGFFKRALAFVLDLLVLNIVLILPFQPLLSSYATMDVFSFQSYDPFFYVLVSVLSLLALFYFVLMEVFVKQTVGMILLNMYAEGNISFWTSVVRHAYLIPLFPFTLLLILDPLYLIFKKERLTERLTHTKTVEYVPMI